ncbi:branched-chain amino acid ABC transporter substrate-binding protein [Nocardioides sp. AE5]|uniref:ABC transporter substrate-binding protein n=1 Tax=Nocardioides sp. AE5 TaxID=2962573 RepID=UPI0028829B06|nr:branched-chain amino acid ABC transporter substrate-binding protein [Nocardioides sp. AE5]MDT0200461.1 branched-chain amino acid ABC transporter substrate-binding protein [Nocardioides sp. AE5]
MKRIWKKWAGIATAGLVIAGMMSACGTDSGNSARELRIGILWPVSGASAAITADFVAGVETALADYKEQLDDRGISTKVIIEDDQGTPSVAISGFQKLANKDQVDVVVGPLNSNNCLAVLPVADRAGIATIVTGTAPSLAEGGWKTFVRGTSPNRVQVNTLVEYAVNDGGWKNIVVIHQETEYGDDLRDNTITAAKERGAEVVETIAYAPGTTNFLSIATKTKNRNPDGVIVAGLGGESVSVIKQLLDAGVASSKIGAYGGTDANVVEEVIPAKDRDGMLLISGFTDKAAELQTDDAKAFVADYQARRGHKPQLYGAIGYVQGQMIINAALGIDGEIDKKSMLDALTTRKPFQSVLGEVVLADSNELLVPLWVQKYDKAGEASPVHFYVDPAAKS